MMRVLIFLTAPFEILLGQTSCNYEVPGSQPFRLKNTGRFIMLERLQLITNRVEGDWFSACV